MDILLKQATIVDPNSNWNGKKADIRIENGIITSIATDIETNAKEEVVQHDNFHVSPGWFDMNVKICEPGHEYKEDFQSGLEAAMAGGFTGIGLSPSTTPPVCNRTSVQYVVNQAKGSIVDVLPYGTVSENQEGLQLAEMYDMTLAGAVAFTDDKESIASAGLMSKALLYLKNFGGLLIAYPFDKTIQLNGQVNEGVVSNSLGLEGIPNLAEELQIARDLSLVQYNDAKLHFKTISTIEGVELIEKAKQKGTNVTCDIAIHNLVLNDAEIETFEANYKVLPPLRTEENRLKLLKQLSSIDVICSDHTPEDVEHKNLEFGAANFGIIGLQTLFGLANTHLRDYLTLDELITKIAINPRSILQQDIPQINEGFKANLTLFNPSLEWTLTDDCLKSKSKNTPFVGAKMTGKPLGVINNSIYSKS